MIAPVLWAISSVLVCVYMGCFSSIVMESRASILVFWVHSRVPFLAITENKVWLTEDVNEGALAELLGEPMEDCSRTTSVVVRDLMLPRTGTCHFYWWFI